MMLLLLMQPGLNNGSTIMQRIVFLALILVTSACTGGDNRSWPFVINEVTEFEEPWAMTFLPDGRLLVTEKPGRLYVVTQAGEKYPVTGVPPVAYGGQGGLGDVVVHPDFARNNVVYLSYAEAGDGNTRGAAVARAKLVLDDDGGGRLDNRLVIWRQIPKVTGEGHYGHRLAFSGDGYLYITSGERQKFDPAQDMKSNLGKVIRLYPDGTIPKDNPFFSDGGIAAQVWTLGHRNPLGIAFDDDERLWVHEMGPQHGDELNLIVAGRNYGYPLVSNGDHYNGDPIPDHDTRPDLEAPKAYWVPAISPAGFIFYSGALFPEWRGDALIGGLSSEALIRVEFDDDEATEVERFRWGARVREVEQGPDGSIWVLEDDRGNSEGRLLQLVPR